jgi:serine/threonine-protein kinase HipA
MDQNPGDGIRVLLAALWSQSPGRLFGRTRLRAPAVVSLRKELSRTATEGNRPEFILGTSTLTGSAAYGSNYILISPRTRQEDMLYVPKDPNDSSALRTAAGRGRVRAMVPGIYTDDLEAPADEWVRRHLLVVLAVLYPDWFVSYSTAALGRQREGVAFISGAKKNLKATELPGVVVKRIRQLRHPETVTVDSGVVSQRTLTGAEEPVLVRMSSPLQTVFEVLRRDRRQPERSLPDPQVRALIERLSRADRLRADRFAERNGLRREYERFRELEATLGGAAVIERPDLQELEVHFHHYRIGRLSELAGGEVRFEYDRHWPIELSGLPLAADGPAYEGPGLPTFFDNLLPEGWAEARLRAVYKIPRDDGYALLRTTPKYLSNVTLRPPGMRAGDVTLDELTASLPHLFPEREGRTSVVEEIGGDPDTRELWLELRRRGATGLSGVQAKLPVHLFAAEGDAHITIGGLRNTSTHILKLPSGEYAGLVPNEWASMELARRVGLHVAELRQVEFQAGSPLSEPALLIERFDLSERLEEAELLPLLEDAASLLGLHRREKYDPSLERIADALADLRLGEDGLTPFFDHVVFGWIIGNGDLHAKNIAVLHFIRPGRLGSEPTYEGARYTPLYDLLNTRLVLRGDLFALPVNGKRNNLRRRDFAVLARRWGWKRNRAEDRIARLVAGVEEHLDAVVAASGLGDEDTVRYRAIVQANIAAL